MKDYKKPRIARVKDFVKHQDIGGKQITIEKYGRLSYILDMPFDKYTFAVSNFVDRYDMNKDEHTKIYYGHVDGLGYFVGEDEIEEFSDIPEKTISKKDKETLLNLGLKFIANDYLLLGDFDKGEWKLAHAEYNDLDKPILNSKDNSIKELKKFAKDVCDLRLSSVLCRINLVIAIICLILVILNFFFFRSSELRFFVYGIEITIILTSFIISEVSSYNLKRAEKRLSIQRDEFKQFCDKVMEGEN